MTVAEFSNEFDLLYNLMSNTAPAIDEYEKSVFLTNAQEEIVKNYFNAQGNKYKEGFDDSIKRHSDFSSLVSTAIYPNGTITKLPSGLSVDDRSHFLLLPSNTFFILNETAVILEGSKQIITQVVPLKHDEYYRLMSKPYKEPAKYQSWRLFSVENNRKQIELIIKSGSILSKYLIRYIKKPEPIILVNLTSEYNGATIEGITTAQTCKLDSTIHREILKRAVELAKSTYLGDLNSTIELNTRSE